jgi:hypothetical protein
LPHSPGWDEENLQPQGGENDDPNPPREGTPDSHVGSREIKMPTNTLKRHWKEKPIRTTKPLQKTGKTG